MSRAVSPLEETTEFEFPEVEALPPPAMTKKQKRRGDALKHFRQVAVRVMTSLALGQDPFQDSILREEDEDNAVKEEGKPEATTTTAATTAAATTATATAATTAKRVSILPTATVAVAVPKTAVVVSDNTNKKGRRPSHVAWGPSATTPQNAGGGGGTQSTKAQQGNRRKSTILEPIPTKAKGNKFASLVRLARFRKMSFRGVGGNKEDEEEMKRKKEEQYKEEEEEVQLPQKARFCTSLSLEAQYAMFKGYEDVLLTKFHDIQQDRREALYRVRTPHKTVTSLHLAEEDKHCGDSAAAMVVGRQQQHGGSVPCATKLVIPPLPASNNYQHQNLTRTSSISGKLNKDIRENVVPKDKQLRLTSRFERAQDILDSIRLSQGSLVTSPRAMQKIAAPKQRNPVDNYNAWSHLWAREFKVQYGKPKRQLTTIK